MNNPEQPLVHAVAISRRFGGLVAVSELSLDIWPGEILGLIGPNGAGKSTTFNLLSGFCKPSAGELYVAGQKCTGKSPKKISRLGLARTFQHNSLMCSMTVRDNILVGTANSLSGFRRAEREQRVEETARLLGLDNHLSHVAGDLPHGLQRLVSIGIAFAARPHVLCLDEPLTGLNQTEATSTLDVFRRIRKDHECSILLVEHNMKAVMQICNRIVVLHHGKQLATGTPAEIRQNDDVVSAYLGRRNGHG